MIVTFGEDLHVYGSAFWTCTCVIVIIGEGLAWPNTYLCIKVCFEAILCSSHMEIQF